MTASRARRGEHCDPLVPRILAASGSHSVERAQQSGGRAAVPRSRESFRRGEHDGISCGVESRDVDAVVLVVRELRETRDRRRAYVVVRIRGEFDGELFVLADNRGASRILAYLPDGIRRVVCRHVLSSETGRRVRHGQHRVCGRAP